MIDAHALEEAVLNGVAAENSKRNYALALDQLAALCAERQQPVWWALLLKYKAVILSRNLTAHRILKVPLQVVN